jgi:predicted DNA-binding transcriptional regulator YafY
VRRADRLFEIIQVLRRSTKPQTAEQIAQQLETSRRTVYRDITTLISQRVPIRGEAGVGYVLDRGYDLPPLMLTPDEIEAVVLGSQWVVAHADPALARAAIDVLAKVAHVLPRGLRDHVDEPAVGTPPRRSPRDEHDVDVGRLRAWCRQGRRLTLRYLDGDDSPTERTVWPFMIGYVATTQVLVAWCELRTDFRHFRVDRIKDVHFLDDRYPVKRAVLRRRWAQQDEASRR